MAPPKKRGLPKPLPEGFILTDTDKKKWRLGRIIGQGGFGLIYLASSDVDRPVAADTDFVVKVEYQENGPLFSELKFYQRAAKPESMKKWKQRKNLDFLGIPTYWGSGLSEYNELRYRFMVMDRLGSDLQKVCERNGGRMKKATVLQLGQGLVTILEYIHENEYVHADIKAANLMLGYKDPEQVYLADYGLSYRYCPDGVHKEYKENPKKGHNGTIEYTSIDAHKGLAPSRRGDLQILGFCLLHWLCGSLPWDNLLKNPVQVQEAKARLMDHLPDSVLQLSASGASTDEVAEFLMYVKTLDYQNKPDYQYLKAVLASVTGRLDFSLPQGAAGASTSKVQDPPRREKKAGRARGGSKAKAVPMERDDVDEEESEEENQVKPKPVPARYIRGPPLNKPQPQQREAEVSPAGGRSLRPRSEHVNYREKDSDDDEEEEEEEEEDKEEEARRRPIPACYVRGPPKGPRAQPKQKTKSQRPGRQTDDLTATSQREEGRCHPQRRERAPTKCDARSQTGTELREGWRAGWPERGAGWPERGARWPRTGPTPQQRCHGDVRYENSEHGGGWGGSALQEADPPPRRGPLSWLVFVGALLLLFLLFAGQDLLV